VAPRWESRARGARVGLTHVTATILNPARPRKGTRLSLLVDSGATYSLVPGATLRRLGIKPHSVQTFTLADGSQLRRRIGDAIFVIDGKRGASPVIFGQPGDSALLGTVSLEALGLMLDPIRRTLRPLPMVLG
jgi:predicted aspartyl protease